MSDWTGTNSVGQSIRAGCDLEMPGPTKWRGKRVLEAIARGEITRAEIEKAAGNVLYLVDRTKGLDGPPEPAERSIDNPSTTALIRQAGIEGLTLLKNANGLLPIRGASKIALIGPNAKRAIVGGGGSATLNPYYTISPFEGICAATSAEVLYSQGCDSAKWLPLASDHCRTYDGDQGVILEYYRGDGFRGEPVSVQRKETTDLFLWDSAPKTVLPAYSFKVKTTLTPTRTGNHTFSFNSVGPGRFLINGQLFIDNWDWTEEGEAMFEASQDVHKSTFLEAGKRVDILVESTNEVRPASKVKSGSATHKYGGCRIGYQEESTVDMLQDAVDAAKAADVAIVCVGLDGEWESEGYDRQTMDLPKNGSQDRLIEAVVAANPNTVVINQSGTPVTMPWADKVPSILQAWYQGQEAGNALAEVVFGKQNPSGKLPTTFPRRLEDNPSFHNWPGENLQVLYGEGIYVGYRHYEHAKVTPLFPFGHGLSYTTFAYAPPTMSAPTLSEKSKLTISVPITNIGSCTGHETVQAYVRDVKSRLPRPQKELQAFAKVLVQPGETVTADLVLDKHSVGYFDASIHEWIAEEGVFEVMIGSSSADIR
jgi:beta-glucosidase